MHEIIQCSVYPQTVIELTAGGPPSMKRYRGTRCWNVEGQGKVGRWAAVTIHSLAESLILTQRDKILIRQ